MSLKFRRIREDDAELLLTWRASPEISRYMFTDLDTHTVDKQREWIRSIAKRKDYEAFMVLDETVPVGFLSYSGIDPVHRRCYAGLYMYDKKASVKYAITIHYYLSYYIFTQLNCNKFLSEVLEINDKATKLDSLRMVYVGRLRQHIYKNGTFYDVLIFEVLKQDWQNMRQIFSDEHMKQAFGLPVD